MNSFSPQMGISCSVTQAVRKVQDEFDNIISNPPVNGGEFFYAY